MEVKVFIEMGKKCKRADLRETVLARYNKLLRNPSTFTAREMKILCMDICLQNDVDLTPFVELNNDNEDDVQTASHAFLMAIQK